MIISASRRTDIPALYSAWFINRIRAGFATLPNPFDRHQISRVSLRPDDVDVIVFWTRFPRPLLPHLQELDHRGYRYYFQFTVMANPRVIEPKAPSLQYSLDAFRRLVDRIGPDRVIWRYDPIVFSGMTDVSFHKSTYADVAKALRGYTHRSVVSIVDLYGKIQGRLQSLNDRGIGVTDGTGIPRDQFAGLMSDLARVARENGMEISSCAEPEELQRYGIRAGKCIDYEYIRQVFGIEVTAKKDPSQREACGCVVSRDIGMYDSCTFGCCYCYATKSFRRSAENRRSHDPTSPSLLGWYD